jgi:hypothetical protein
MLTADGGSLERIEPIRTSARAAGDRPARVRNGRHRVVLVPVPEWTGQQAQGYSRATANRIAVNHTSAIANRQARINVATFLQWVDAAR